IPSQSLNKLVWVINGRFGGLLAPNAFHRREPTKGNMPTESQQPRLYNRKSPIVVSSVG
ncbi:hypothetical protein CCACVL1_13918, partial [Corchorus capsularis]